MMHMFRIGIIDDLFFLLFCWAGKEITKVLSNFLAEKAVALLLDFLHNLSSQYDMDIQQKLLLHIDKPDFS